MSLFFFHSSIDRIFRTTFVSIKRDRDKKRRKSNSYKCDEFFMLLCERLRAFESPNPKKKTKLRQIPTELQHIIWGFCFYLIRVNMSYFLISMIFIYCDFCTETFTYPTRNYQSGRNWVMYTNEIQQQEKRTHWTFLVENTWRLSKKSWTENPFSNNT